MSVYVQQNDINDEACRIVVSLVFVFCHLISKIVNRKIVNSLMFVKISEQPSLYNDLEKKSVREILEDINTETRKWRLPYRGQSLK